MTKQLNSTEHFEKIPIYKNYFEIDGLKMFPNELSDAVNMTNHNYSLADRIVAFHMDVWHIGNFISEDDDKFLQSLEDELKDGHPPDISDVEPLIIFKNIV